MTKRSSWRDAAAGLFFRVAAAGIVPPRLFLPAVPDERTLPGRTGRLRLEIVTHCWKYDHLLAFQLASLARFPPSKLDVRVTVFHATSDEGTVRLLEEIGRAAVPGVEWNWAALPESRLFRRAIGRNLAALATPADWIWFTDCDVVFHEGCLDGLAEALQGRRDRLVFPREERITPLLPPDDPLLARPAAEARLTDADLDRFFAQELPVAKGPMQIVHGDVARACGYCAQIGLYQKSAERWQKAWEDRAFRWLLRTDGVPIEVPSVYRIRHAAKGRYGSPLGAAVRGTIRRTTSR